MGILDRSTLVAEAEVDPWALLAQLEAGDPDQIEELAAAFYRASGHTQQAIAADAQAKRYVRAGYVVNGAAPIDYSAQARRTSTSLASAADTLPKIATLMTSVAGALVTATQSAASEVQNLDGELDRIEREWTAFVQGPGHHLPVDDQNAARAGYVQDAVAAVRRWGGFATSTVMDYEHTLTRASKSMADLGYVAPDDLLEAGEQPTAVLPVGSDPTTVAGWWSSLTLAQQEYLMDHSYGTLGQLKGLPALVLDTANRHRIIDDRDAVIRELATLDSQNDPDGSQRAALAKKLADDNGIISEITSPGVGSPPQPTYVLAYDPNGKDGQTGVAISYGNPDTADNTGVVVPGTGNNASKLSSVGKNGRDLYNTMTGNRAVVVWLDGPEPQSVLPDAGLDSYANDSAPNLVTDIAGLRAAHEASTGDAGHLTMIGHSYGSYIAGKAMTQGADVDDVVFVGSPGVGVDHASDLGIDSGHVWDGEAGDDPILWTGKRFTPDPMTGNNPEQSDFGAQHFNVDGSHGHSEYYQPRSNSLQNMADIADGDYGAVQHVDAPNYRGLKELPGDLISTVTTPIETPLHTAKDLVTGHPIQAVKDGFNGAVKQGKNLINNGEDVIDTIGGLLP